MIQYQKQEPQDLFDTEKENIILFHELMERIRNTAGTFRDSPEIQVSQSLFHSKKNCRYLKSGGTMIGLV
jgi:hypothetical protein